MNLPPIHDIQQIQPALPDTKVLTNGIVLHGFNGLKNDILKLDLVFNAGKWVEPHQMVAEFTARLFKSGTAQFDAHALSEKIEFLGSSIKAGVGYNTFTVSVSCMNKHLEATLNLLLLCLNEINFPENEITHEQQKAKSQLKLALEKNDYIADITFRKLLFGENHPYGYASSVEAIDAIARKSLLDYYDTYVIPSLCTLYIAGKYAHHELTVIENTIGKWHKTPLVDNSALHLPEFPEIPKNPVFIKKEKSVQSSIVIGNIGIDRMHEDYPAFILLNTIFGGYFGSRLMSNIREEKGLTYGIYSSLFILKHTAVFSIQTDTNVDTKDLCLSEIYKEMERLQTELIPEEEIRLARNYLLGKFLHRTDGPFNQMDVYKSYCIENVNISKFEEIVEGIRQQTAVSLQRVAQKYFLKEKMLEVVVG